MDAVNLPSLIGRQHWPADRPRQTSFVGQTAAFRTEWIVAHPQVGRDWYPEVGQCQAQMLSFGLRTDPIIDGITEPLFAAEVSLRHLNALMAEQKLDLLNLAAGVVTQAGASAPKVVWSDTGQTTSTAGGRNH
jgi:hypothetical protein